MDVLQFLKVRLARMTEPKPIGIAIGKLFGERIPSRGLRIHSRDLTPQVKSQLLFRTYESAEIRAVCRHLRSDLDVIELGASIGVLSCHIRRKLAINRHLYAIEPDLNLMKSIEKNLRANGLYSGVTILNRAISKVSGEQNFVRRKSNLNGHTAQLCQRGTMTVEGVTLSSLIGQLGIGKYALVCDIEGAEAELIAGDFEAFNKCEQIVIELHQRDHSDSEQLIEQLKNRHGFTLQAQYGKVYVLARPAPENQQYVRAGLQSA
jgi:FkbM family methyltransferase